MDVTVFTANAAAVFYQTTPTNILRFRVIGRSVQFLDEIRLQALERTMAYTVEFTSLIREGGQDEENDLLLVQFYLKSNRVSDSSFFYSDSLQKPRLPLLTLKSSRIEDRSVETYKTTSYKST